MFRPWFSVLVCILCIGGGIALLNSKPTPNWIGLIGRDTGLLTSPCQCKVESILVKNGQWVHKGDPLLRLTSLEDQLLQDQFVLTLFQLQLQWTQHNQQTLAQLQQWKWRLDREEARLDLDVKDRRAQIEGSRKEIKSLQAQLGQLAQAVKLGIQSPQALASSESRLRALQGQLPHLKQALHQAKSQFNTLQNWFKATRQDLEIKETESNQKSDQLNQPPFTLTPPLHPHIDQVLMQLETLHGMSKRILEQMHPLIKAPYDGYISQISITSDQYVSIQSPLISLSGPHWVQGWHFGTGPSPQLQASVCVALLPKQTSLFSSFGMSRLSSSCLLGTIVEVQSHSSLLPPPLYSPESTAPPMWGQRFLIRLKEPPSSFKNTQRVGWIQNETVSVFLKSSLPSSLSPLK